MKNPNYSGPKDDARPTELEAYESSGKWTVEPKLDGMWIEMTVGDPKKGRPHSFKSRAGIEPNESCTSELSDIPLPLAEGTVLCGELEVGTDRASIRYKDTGFYGLHLFDILNLEGNCLKHLSQKERREVLGIIYPEIQFCTMHKPGRFQLVPFFTNMFKQRYDHFISNGGEGVVLKRSDAKFSPGKNPDSVRVKGTLTDDFVLMEVGKTDGGEPTGVWGQYHDNELVYVMRAQPRADMSILNDNNLGVVGEFKGWGRQSSGTLRSAQFVRVRTDKPAEDCILKNSGDKVPTRRK